MNDQRVLHRLEAGWPSSVMRSNSFALSLVVLAVLAVVTFSLLDARTIPLMVNTIGLATATCICALPVSFAVAWCVARCRPYGGSYFHVFVGVSLFLPLYLQLTGWQAGFGYQGWWQSLHGTLETEPMLAGWRGAIWIHTVAAVPWGVMIFIVGLQGVPAAWEASALLETSRWRTFWHVTLPATRPAWTVAAIWIFALTAGDMTATDVFRIRTFAEEAFLGFALGDPQSVTIAGPIPAVGPPAAPHRLAIALGGGLTLWLAGAMYVVLPGWLAAGRVVGLANRRPHHWGEYRRLSTGVLVLMLIVVWGLPVGNLVFHAGLNVDLRDAVLVRTWSPIKAMTQIGAAPWRFRDDFIWSFACANLVAATVLLIAIPLAWWARSSRLAGALCSVITAVCLVMPGPLVGIGIISLLNHDWPILTFLYDRTLVAPCLAMSVRALPLSLMILWQAFRSLPSAPLDAARLDGAGFGRRLLLIVLPQRTGAIMTAGLVAMAISVGDLAASILVAPPGVNTVAITIFGLVHYGVDDRLAGLSLSLLAIFAILGTSIGWQLQRRGWEYN